MVIEIALATAEEGLGFARQGPSTEFIQSAAAGGVEGLGTNGILAIDISELTVAN